METIIPHQDRPQPALLDLPDEALMLIALHSGIASAVRLSSTCTRLRSLIDSEAMWRSFLHRARTETDVRPGQAKEAILQHYCKACDLIVSGVAMFYSGGICINCEYSDPNHEKTHHHFIGRVFRYRSRKERRADAAWA